MRRGICALKREENATLMEEIYGDEQKN